MTEEEGKLWRKLANALDKINAAYRLHRSPSLTAVTEAAQAKARLRKLGVYPWRIK